MTEARPLHPTDLIAFVPFGGLSLRNEAWTRERLGADESARTLGLIVDQFVAFARGRRAWICTRHGRLRGLVGARQRGGRQAWEIDYLIDVTRTHDAAGKLLEGAIASVGDTGAEKLFLRLSADSDLLPVARSAGFLPYQEEVLYAKAYSRDDAVEPITVRSVGPADAYSLYRLYNQATPEVTRRSEAATFREWHAAQERRWLRNGVQLLCEQASQVSGVVRAAREPQGVVAELVVGETEIARARSLIVAAAQALNAGGAPVFVIVPKASEALARQLEGGGFAARQDFVSLMRRTTRTLALPSLSPAIATAKNAVGV